MVVWPRAGIERADRWGRERHQQLPGMAARGQHCEALWGRYTAFMAGRLPPFASTISAMIGGLSSVCPRLCRHSLSLLYFLWHLDPYFPNKEPGFRRRT